MTRAAARLAKQAEGDLLYDLVQKRLQATWADVEILSRIVKVPLDEAEGIVTDALFDFLAEQLVDQGIEDKDAKRILGDAMKDADKEAGEQEEEEEDPDDV